MKAADIADEAFLDAVEQAIKIRTARDGYRHDVAMRWDVAAVLAGHPEAVGKPQDWPNMPWRIVLAKAKRLIRRGVLDGCYCGCRGDFRSFPRQ